MTAPARRPLIAGNWKMHLTHLEAIGMVQKLAFSLKDPELEAAEVVVLPPFTALRSVQTLVTGDKLEVGYGAQDLSVQDSGVGINPEFIPYVFERFRQADASTTRKHGGLGLGLSIVRHLVELHGGTVHAESRGAGLGSVFTVKLHWPSVTSRPV